MSSKSRRSQLSFAILITTLGIVVPYLVAWRISPDGTVFSGFLLNPVDGFSYLAKMRQGHEGSFLFRLPYAADPGSGTYLFIFYLLLGHISRVLGIPMIAVYHIARVIFSLCFFSLLYTFFSTVFTEIRLKWAAFIFCLFGSGLGWIGLLVFGRQPIDLWVPEAIPFLSAYANPHFPLAAALFVGGILLVYSEADREWRHMALALVCGFTLGAVLPFVTISLFLLLGLWVAWERLVKPTETVSSWLMRRPLSMALIVVGALPWLIYDFWLSQTHPVISQWNAQNLTPSPPLVDTLFGFGLMFLLAVISLGSRPWKTDRTGRLFTVWLLLGIALLYFPLPFQRRLSLGLFIPMSGLSAWWLGEKIKDHRRFRLSQAALLTFSMPSLILVIAAGVAGVARGEKAIVYSSSELNVYEWVDQNVPKQALMLADPLFGNRLPAFASVNVLYGHPFETPNAEESIETISSLLEWNGSPERGLEHLSQLGVDWVFYHQDLSSSVPPTWLEKLQVRVEVDQFELLENVSQ